MNGYRRAGVGQVGLRVEEVWKAYGRRQVLRGASLQVDAGALVGVFGENGAGKSTLLKVICGQLAPDAGRVLRGGQLGYCPQHVVLDERLTVAQHLRFFQVAYRLPGLQRAEELLDTLGCVRFRRDRVGVLSGGTRQKINLVLALMHDPPVLVLDEPYQGFDWDTYLRFWELAGELRSRGRSVLMVSHLAHDLDRFDGVHQLRDGRLEPFLAAAPDGEAR
ncbi:ABC transporter ATP-binding protein [Streptomyces sp. A012304]|uniref:ABC transporter ATP-binding protein n=1 Tax=Streptomyces sp. A012304 TaxID=375446 RepID=UPI0022304FDB|nr:ABC transporter ATP-binding protein [Streptomyces sp. A012304]GKQ38484.1 ABC transporter ATP-binding protein [Streptomyces sp. A012304]